MSVGERIKEARRRLNWTQSDLAREVGVSRSAVAQWETERAGQIRGNLTRIAAVLEVSPAWLLVGREEDEGHFTGDELAVLRLYRLLSTADKALILTHMRRLSGNNRELILK